MEAPSVINFTTDKRTVENPIYKNRRVPTNNVQGPIALNAGRQLVEFKLPAEVMNLSRMCLDVSVECAAAGAGKFIHTFEDLGIGEIANSIKLCTAGGVDLCDINELPVYMKSKLKMKTKYEDFINRDPMHSYYSASQIGVGLAANNTSEANLIPEGVTIQNNNPYKIAGGATFVSPFKFSDPKYSMQSGDNAALVRNRRYLFSDVKDSIFSEDKDIYSPVDLYLRIYLNPKANVAFVSDSAADPSDATAEVPVITLKNLNLWVPVQRNVVLRDELVNSVMSGNHTWTIPYTFVQTHQMAAGQNSTLINFTPQYGRKLHHVTLVAGNTNKTLNTSVDINNYNGAKITRYRTYLDGQGLQDEFLECAQPANNAAALGSGDWRENKKFCLNKFLNLAQYQMNWTHTDAFYDPETGDEGLDIDLGNSAAGMNVEAVRSYQYEIVSPGNIVIYTLATYLRKVMFDQTGNILFG